jgi:polyisoprenoid-binding protein YceI
MAESTTASPLADVKAGTWTLDAARSTVAFQSKSIWGLVTVKGVFTQVSGQAEAAGDGTAQGTLVITAASLDTKQAKRDKHLRSADFFDVENHPDIVFKTTDIRVSGSDTADVNGELTVHGVTQPVTLTAKAVEAGNDGVTLVADLDIQRADYQMNFNQLGMMGGLAKISITARFTPAS